MDRGLLAAHWRHLKAFAPARTNLRIGVVGLAAFFGSIAESAVLVLIALTADSLIREVPDVVVAGRDLSRTTAALLALGFVGARIIMTLIATRTSSAFSAEVMERAQTSLISAYLGSSHAARSARPVGDLATMSSNHCRFTGELANSFAIVATGACGLLAFGGMALAVNPLATLGIAAIGTVLLMLMRPLRSRSRAAADSFSEGARSIGHELTEVENLHREIEVFQVQRAVEERLAVDTLGSAERFRHLRFLSESVPQLFQAILLGAAVLSLLVIVNLPNQADLAGVGAVVLLLIRSMSSAQGVVSGTQRVIEFGAYTAGLEVLVDSLRSDSRTFGSTTPPTFAPVDLQDVRFSYGGDLDVLHGLSVRFERGELIGVVGPSGAGKSTFVELLLRLRMPTGGSITYDGVPIDEIDAIEFSRRVAFVPQHPALIVGTIFENVDLFRGLPEDRIRAALKQAHLEDEVNALPDGIHTRLGPDDRSLSGGQQQRLTIARSLAGDPEILVLDEPTSALDAVSERTVRETLTELPTGRIVIVVAHRYSTLRTCSRILVLRDGVLEMDATPDEVAAQSDFFRTMVSEAG